MNTNILDAVSCYGLLLPNLASFSWIGLISWRQPPSYDSMQSAKAREEGVPPRVLLVDDEPALLRLMARALKAAGFETLCARSGREALCVLRSQSLDAMITDIGMPELDGISLLRSSRHLAPGLPVIVITGDTTEATAEEVGRLGAVALLLKPVRVGELLELSRRVVRRERH